MIPREDPERFRARSGVTRFFQKLALALYIETRFGGMISPCTLCETNSP